MVVSMPNRRVGNLPVDATSFVGRRTQSIEAKQLLTRTRLLTMTGIGGVGKTRLALSVAADVHRAFGDGVWLVDLSHVSDSRLLAETVAAILRISDRSSRPALEVVTDYLRDKHVLLVLDNCEHVLDSCAVLADTLLRAAPGLRILATSRQALNAQGEHIMPVPPLSLPDHHQPQPSPSTLSECEAVSLFVDRAAATVGELALGENDWRAVAGICQRLDGLPLAIELAAPWLRSLSPQELQDRLRDRFRLLTSGSSTLMPRHRTLRALIDWSFDLCTPAEKSLWARAAAFVGSFDLEAAEAVCATGGIPAEDVVYLVDELINKSILIREGSVASTRYCMLETIRQYGREKLAARGEKLMVARRHRDYFLQLAAQARADVFGSDQVSWFARLQDDHANLRAAMEFCRDRTGEQQAGLQMASDLFHHWITSFHITEGRACMNSLLNAASAPTPARARALWATGALAIIQGDPASATAQLDEARRLANTLGDPLILGYATLFHGVVAMFQKDSEKAIADYADALRVLRGVGDQFGVAMALNRLSMAHSFLGNTSHAIALGEECLAVSDACGETWHRGFALMALGIDVWRQGDHKRALALEQASLRIHRLLDSRVGMALNMEVLAWIAAGDGQHERAAQILGILHTLWRRIGVPLASQQQLYQYHDQCESRTRNALSQSAFLAAFQRGELSDLAESIDFVALEKNPTGAAPADISRPVKKSITPLTKRESQIAALIAQGLSNKEIAAKLVISPRTAECHVENILTKLSLNSRTHIALWFAKRASCPE